MKKLALLALVAALATSCSDDETSIPQEDLQLATPALHMRVSTASGESPFTGVLTVSHVNQKARSILATT